MNTDSGLEKRYLKTRVCIAGGGPAGMLLGYLLARAGIAVVVLEKHADFLRDFRGDTIHPSTLQIMHELGLLTEFLQRPHEKAFRLSGYINDVEIPLADFTKLHTLCKYLAFMPQWDFLDFIAAHARSYPSFTMRMQADVYSLVQEDDRVCGVRARTPGGELVVNADLVVAADGRHSVVRERADLPLDHLGAPMDVLWMRLSRQPGDPEQPLARFMRGGILVMIVRAAYWQCGFVIGKGGYNEIRRHGLEALRRQLATIAPHMADRVSELTSWNDIKLLTVKVDRLRQWCRGGLLCLGDAAHAMSPVGGVGINLVQDAVAAANLLTRPLLAERCTLSDLRRVQRRRLWPTRVTQALQLAVQNRIISRVMRSDAPLTVPWPLRLLHRYPRLRAIPAWLIGVGIRPEHIRHIGPSGQ